jgi:hypothetical protein
MLLLLLLLFFTGEALHDKFNHGRLWAAANAVNAAANAAAAVCAGDPLHA